MPPLDQHAAMAPLVDALHQRAHTARKHTKTEPAVDAAQRSALRLSTEQTRGAAAQTVSELNDAKTQEIDRDEFKKKLRAAVDAEMGQPTSESQANEVMEQGAKKASTTLRGSLDAERDAAAGKIKDAAKPSSDVAPSTQPPLVETNLQLEKTGSAPAPVNSSPAVPPPLPPERLDYTSDRAPTDQVMSENDVTTDQLKKGNEPEFGSALSARSDAEKHEAAAPAAYRSQEQKVQLTAAARAHATAAGGLTGMHGLRGIHIATVGLHQQSVHDRDKVEREQVTAGITAIKNETKNAVGRILSEMDREAAAIFEAGLKTASDRYEAAFSDAKGGIGNWLTNWGDDWDQLITDALATGRAAYMARVDQAIDDVSTCVERKLKEAKTRVAEGKKQVDDFVAGLDKKSLRFGIEAREAVGPEFEALETQISERRDALVNSLAQQFKASYQRMNAREEELREANKSLWRRVYDATVGLVKRIIEFKNLLFSALAKAASVIGDIISDPIGFLGNLISAVMQGLRNFISHLGVHLQKGLMEWLLGAVAGTGLKLPEAFDLDGVISIVLQVLGITYENFRARAVALVGAPVAAALEKGADVFNVFRVEGVVGIGRLVKEKLTDLKSMVVDAVLDFVESKVISAGITWIIGLLNPVSAFFKACKAIYEIVKFFITHSSEVVDLVSAVIDSVVDIAAGSLGAAITKVEDALARAIPVAIGFLASLLGLGDPSKPVRKTIEKAQSPVNKAIDWIIMQAAKVVKIAGKAITGLLGKKEPPMTVAQTHGTHGASAVAPGGSVASPQASKAAVKEHVVATLGQKLTSEHTPEQARAIVSSLAADFRPLGVSRLYVASTDKEGRSPIVLEMSPGDEIAYLSAGGAVKGRSVTLNVELTLSAPGDDPRVPLAGLVLEANKAERKDGREYVYMGAASNRPRTRTRSGKPVGGIMFPETAGKIQLITWNTSSQAVMQVENSTHAEAQFFHWIKQMSQDKDGQEVLARITGIEAHLKDYSPCPHCATMLRDIDNAIGHAIAKKRLYWYALYHGPHVLNPTTAESVREMSGAGWTLVAPGGELPDSPNPLPVVLGYYQRGPK